MTRLFPPVGSEGTEEKYRLSDQQIAFFNENGYLADFRIIFHGQVDALRGQLEGVMHPAPEITPLIHQFADSAAPASSSDRTAFRASGAWRMKMAFHDLLWHAGLLIPAAQLLGGNVRFWQDQLFFKPPTTGAALGWHQESAPWEDKISALQHLVVWIALDNMTEANGCLRVVPGSHKWGRIPGLPANPGHDLSTIHDHLNEEQKSAFVDKPLPMAKGWAVFMHPHLLQASGENNTEEVSRAMSITLMKSGVKTETPDPVLPGVPPIKKGKKVEGECFPLLWKSPKEEAVGAEA